MIDLGTGNNNKMCVSCLSRFSSSHPIVSNWAMDNKQEVSMPPSRIHLLSLAS